MPEAVTDVIEPGLQLPAKPPHTVAVKPPDAVTVTGLWYRFTALAVEVTLKLHDGSVPGWKDDDQDGDNRFIFLSYRDIPEKETPFMGYWAQD